MSDTDGTAKKSFVVTLVLFAGQLAGVALLVAALWQLGAAGWGERLWLAGALATLVIRVPFAVKVRGNTIVQARKDAMERATLTAMFVTMLVLPTLHLATPVLEFAAYTLPGWAWIAGAVLQLPYLWLFWRSHADLGRNWSPTLDVRENHKLVTGGIYRHVRHPMYSAIWLGAIAQPLLIQNWIAGPPVLLAFLAMYATRVPKEEALMRDRFGDAYHAYASRTGRLLPKP